MFFTTNISAFLKLWFDIKFRISFWNIVQVKFRLDFMFRTGFELVFTAHNIRRSRDLSHRVERNFQLFFVWNAKSDSKRAAVFCRVTCKDTTLCASKGNHQVKLATFAPYFKRERCCIECFVKGFSKVSSTIVNAIEYSIDDVRARSHLEAAVRSVDTVLVNVVLVRVSEEWAGQLMPESHDNVLKVSRELIAGQLLFVELRQIKVYRRHRF